MATINNLPLCITLGDPLGIGPEITARTLDFLQKKIMPPSLKVYEIILET